jgi:hypothetical protein
MTDDLVKRLRKKVAKNRRTSVEVAILIGCEFIKEEAAERIEQLTERMHSSERVLNEIVNGDLRLAEKTGTKVRYSPADERLVERVRKMEKALRKIETLELDPRNSGQMWVEALRQIARKALGEKKND